MIQDSYKGRPKKKKVYDYFENDVGIAECFHFHLTPNIL